MESKNLWPPDEESRLGKYIDVLVCHGIEQVEKLATRLEDELERDVLEHPRERQQNLHDWIWVHLSHASLLLRCFKAERAEWHATLALNKSLELEKECSGTTESCFGVELTLSAMVLADAFETAGKFRESIQTLTEVFFGECSIVDDRFFSIMQSRVMGKLDSLGTTMGYDDLAAQLLMEYPRKTVAHTSSPADFWKTPCPIRGFVSEEFVNEFVELQSAYRRDFTLGERMAYYTKVQEFLGQWQEEEPDSNEVRGFVLQNKLRLAGTNALIGNKDEVAKAWPDLGVAYVLFLADAAEYGSSTLFIFDTLHEFVRTLLDAAMTSPNDWVIYSQLVSQCLDMVSSVDEVVKDDFPLTQASIIRKLVWAELKIRALLCEDQVESALHERRRHTAILDELLLRDPQNDRAKRIQSRFSQMSTPPREEDVAEIQSWSWDVVPLLTS